MTPNDIQSNGTPVDAAPSEPALHPVITDRLAQLQALFPEAFSEDALDVDALRAALGEQVASGPERYGFSFAGKREARQALQTPAQGTLHPAPGEGVHEDTTRHAFIEGDNLEVLKLLYRSYAGAIKLIYIDPPYNTGNDFVYPDNFAEPLQHYLKLTGQADKDGKLLTSATDRNGGGHRHSNWMRMMYPRLFMARQLLRDDGVIFISIDDNEVHNLRLLMNEIFGEENFVGSIIWKRRQNVDSRAKSGLSSDHEYLIVYGKNEARLRGQEKDFTKYSNPDNDPLGAWMSADLTGLATKDQRPNLHYPLIDPETSITYEPPENGWRYGKPTMTWLIEHKRIIWPSASTGRPRLRKYLDELTNSFTGLSSVFNTQGTRELKDLFDGKDVLDFPKPVALMKLVVQQGTAVEEGDIVLDFFAGSATTAQAVLELNREDGGNRRFIMVQLPEPTGNKQFPTITEIGKERIQRVIKRMQAANDGTLLPATTDDLGFKVFKLVQGQRRVWRGVRDTAQYAKQMELATDPLPDTWQPVDLLWEIALDEGYTLNARMEPIADTTAQHLYRVTDPDKQQQFVVCLDDVVPHGILNAQVMGDAMLFICRDAALTDTTASNLKLQSRDLGYRLKTI